MHNSHGGHTILRALSDTVESANLVKIRNRVKNIISNPEWNHEASPVYILNVGAKFKKDTLWDWVRTDSRIHLKHVRPKISGYDKNQWDGLTQSKRDMQRAQNIVYHEGRVEDSFLGLKHVLTLLGIWRRATIIVHMHDCHYYFRNNMLTAMNEKCIWYVSGMNYTTTPIDTNILSYQAHLKIYNDNDCGVQKVRFTPNNNQTYIHNNINVVFNQDSNPGMSIEIKDESE
jgi:hypothetical protein